MDRALFDELPEQAAPERSGGARARLRLPACRQVEWRALSLDSSETVRRCSRQRR